MADEGQCVKPCLMVSRNYTELPKTSFTWKDRVTVECRDKYYFDQPILGSENSLNLSCHYNGSWFINEGQQLLEALPACRSIKCKEVKVDDSTVEKIGEGSNNYQDSYELTCKDPQNSFISYFKGVRELDFNCTKR